MISVIIPTYNRCELLFRAIESVLNQTYGDLELLIIDDGSTDNTHFEVSHLLREEKKIRYIKTPNRGVSAARNLGIKISNGKYIAFLDSDDEWLPEKLKAQINYLKEFPHLNLVHGEEIWMRKGKRVNQKNIHRKRGGEIFSQCLDLCAISPSTVLVKKELLNQVGFFREDFPVCEDYDLWLRITSKYPVGFIDKPLIVKYGGHPGQLSAKFFGMDYFRIKSMKTLLSSGELKPAYQKLLLDKFQMKIKILQEGARKHDNNELLKKLRAMLN